MASSVNSQSNTVLAHLEDYKNQHKSLDLPGILISYVKNPQTPETTQKVKAEVLKFFEKRHVRFDPTPMKSEIDSLIDDLSKAHQAQTNFNPVPRIKGILQRAQVLSTAQIVNNYEENKQTERRA